MCYQNGIPCHVTALYIYAIINLTILINITLVNADISILDDRNETVAHEIEDLAAKFGGDIPVHGVWGHLILAQPNDGCKPISKPPHLKLNKTSGIGNRWIALIKRDNCDFDVKVLNAQRAGYVAVIVHNDVNHSNALLPMAGGRKAHEVDIPSVFIGYRDGIALRDNFSGRSNYTLVIKDPSDIPAYHFIFLIFVMFASVIGVCFVGLVAIVVMKWYRDRRYRQRSRLSRQHLKKIPTHKFKKGDPYDLCAICLDDYEDNDKLRVLPCNHAYHQKCIDPWLTKSKKTCPICKQKVIPGRNRDSDTGSDSSDSSDEETGGGGVAAAENTPLLGPQRGRGGAGRGVARTRGDTFTNSGVPEIYRPPAVQPSSESSTASSVAGQMYNVCQSSVEVHSEPDYTTRVRAPKRRGHGGNGRYAMVNESGADRYAADDMPVTSAATTAARPRSNRTWEYASTPTDSQPTHGAAADSGDDVILDVDDVAPSNRRLSGGRVNRGAVITDDASEDDDDNVTSRSLDDKSASGGGARPKTQRQSPPGLLLVHEQPDASKQQRKGVRVKRSTSSGKKRKERSSDDQSEMENDAIVGENETETIRKSPTHCESESTAALAAPRVQAGDDATVLGGEAVGGAVGGTVGSSTSDGHVPPPTSGDNADDVIVVQSSSRHKRRNKKKRKPDEQA